jgi:hypothetical protein
MHEQIKFYNAGDPFTEKFQYTKPDTDFKVENGVAYWQVTAKKEGFFTVPREISVGDGGTHLLNIHREVTDRYGARGVIRIDFNIEKIDEDDPTMAYIANSDASAKKKGALLWKAFLRKSIEDFEEENQRRTMQKNLPRMKPSSFVRHAFTELGIAIPEDEVFIKAGVQKTALDDLLEKFSKLEQVLTPDQKKLLEKQG